MARKYQPRCKTATCPLDAGRLYSHVLPTFTGLAVISLKKLLINGVLLVEAVGAPPGEVLEKCDGLA